MARFLSSLFFAFVILVSGSTAMAHTGMLMLEMGDDAIYDFDFVTACNWTSTGTFNLAAYRGTSSNVISSYTIYYRKQGAAGWSEVGGAGGNEIVISSTGVWEVANNWNKSGNDVLTHSYRDITAIDSCTTVYFNETTLGNTVGNYFLCNAWYGCTNLASMPTGFNLPSGITTVGSDFLRAAWRGCTGLTSMPTSFTLPSGITTAGDGFLRSTWYGCADLTAMPSGFNIPSGITTVGDSFLLYTWGECAGLASMPSGFNLPSGITNAGINFLYSTWLGCTSLTSMPAGFNLPSGITTVSANFLYYAWLSCAGLASMPTGFNLPSGITTVGDNFLYGTWLGCTSLDTLPRDFNLPSGITSAGADFCTGTFQYCSSLGNASGTTQNIDFDHNATDVFDGTDSITPTSVTAPASVAVDRPAYLVQTITVPSGGTTADIEFNGNGKYGTGGIDDFELTVDGTPHDLILYDGEFTNEHSFFIGSSADCAVIPDADVNQNPDNTDAYWSQANITSISAGGGLIATADSDLHVIYKGSLLSASTSHVFSVKAKAGTEANSVDFIRLAMRDDDGYASAYFDLTNGTVETTSDLEASGISSVDSDGYYRCYIKAAVGLVTSQNYVYINAAEKDEDITFAGDASDVSIYVKDINLMPVWSGTVNSGNVCTHDYDQPTNGAEATSGADLADIVAGSVTNNSTQ
jgi:hypothetical protein